ncbi:MAG: rod shape-determining protein MreD [Sphingomonas sp.]
MTPVEFIGLGKAERQPRARWLAPLSIMIGSLVTLLPIVTIVPVLPPFGLMMLLGWRLLRPDAMRVWAPVPLGLFDDLVSGQPLGSAMLLWTLCGLMIDVLDTRLVWRDFWQDWLIASGALGFCLIAGRFLAAPFSAHVDTAMLLQLLASVALYPLIARISAWLDSDVRKN